MKNALRMRPGNKLWVSLGMKMRFWGVLICPVFALGAPDFRIEKRPVPGGSELITVFARVPEANELEEGPLVSVLRDTLGDENSENDRLRYVWVLSSTAPGLLQRLAG